MWHTVTANAGNSQRILNAAPKIGGPIMKQPTDLEADDKYSELKSFIGEVNNILGSYNMLQTEKVAIIKIG